MKNIFTGFILFFCFQFTASLSAQETIADFGKCRIKVYNQSDRQLHLSKVADEQVLTSESGKFNFHFSETGNDALPFIDNNGNNITDYIDTILVEIDDIYKQEVTDLDLSFPNLETVDIYFYSLGNLYGETTLQSTCDYPYTGKSEIHVNSFINSFFTKGMNMIRVTLAHEFHHVLQFQKGAWLGRDCTSDSFSSYDFLFYYEISAVFFEEAVYNNINDYYNYIKSSNNVGRTVFSEPNSPRLYSNTSDYIYGAGVFFIFIRDQYGLQKAKEFDKRILELLPNYPPTTSMAKASTDVLNKPISEVFNEYSTAVSLTGKYKIEGHSFTESNYYPLLSKKNNIIPVSGSGIVSITIPIPQTGFSVYWFSYNNKEYPVVFSNGNFEQMNDEGIQLVEDHVKANINFNTMKINYSVENITDFKTIRASLIDTSLKSVSLFSEGGVYLGSNSDLFAFPNPVILANSGTINIPVNGSSDSPKINIQIIDVGGTVLLSKNIVKFSSDLVIYEINLQNELKSKISSGVYFYFVSSNDKLLNSGKFAVIK